MTIHNVKQIKCANFLVHGIGLSSSLDIDTNSVDAPNGRKMKKKIILIFTHIFCLASLVEAVEEEEEERKKTLVGYNLTTCCVLPLPVVRCTVIVAVAALLFVVYHGGDCNITALIVQCQ